jgi:hypothetical protein
VKRAPLAAPMTAICNRLCLFHHHKMKAGDVPGLAPFVVEPLQGMVWQRIRETFVTESRDSRQQLACNASVNADDNFLLDLFT